MLTNVKFCKEEKKKKILRPFFKQLQLHLHFQIYNKTLINYGFIL